MGSENPGCRRFNARSEYVAQNLPRIRTSALISSRLSQERLVLLDFSWRRLRGWKI